MPSLNLQPRIFFRSIINMRVESVSLALAALPLVTAQKCSPLHLIYGTYSFNQPGSGSKRLTLEARAVRRLQGA